MLPGIGVESGVGVGVEGDGFEASEFFGRHVDVVDVGVFVGFVDHVCLLAWWGACGGLGGAEGLLVHAVDVVDGVFCGVAGEAAGRGWGGAFAFAEEGGWGGC